MPDLKDRPQLHIFWTLFAVVLLFGVVILSGSYAGKGGKGGGKGGDGGQKVRCPSRSFCELAGPIMVEDQNSDGLPNYGDTVTWEVSTDATDKPIVQLQCEQNGNLVYSASGGFYEGYPWPWTKNMTLRSTWWDNAGGGAADCTALLYGSNGRGGFDYYARVDFFAGA